MKRLLVVALVAAVAYAAPLAVSEVEIVQPRQVLTGAGGGSVGGGLATAQMHRIRDLLHQLGFSDSFGDSRFSSLFPSGFAPDNSRCDSKRLHLSDQQYEVVTRCQRSNADYARLKQCLISDLPDDLVELKQFLAKEEYELTSLSTSFSFTSVNGQSERRMVVTFGMCPKVEINTVDTDIPVDTPVNTDTTGAGPRPGTDLFSSFPGFFGPNRPPVVIGFPNIFEHHNPFEGIGDVFRPFLQHGDNSGLLPFFPEINTDVTNVDLNKCESEKFDLPRADFNKAKNCQFGETPFAKCLAEQLESTEETKGLLEFVAGDQHAIVSTRFYSSVSSVNGVETRKRSVNLRRCEKKMDSPAAQGETVAQPASQPGQTAADAGPTDSAASNAASRDQYVEP